MVSLPLEHRYFLFGLIRFDFKGCRLSKFKISWFFSGFNSLPTQCRLMITFENSLNPDQARHDGIPERIFLKKVILKRSADNKKTCKTKKKLTIPDMIERC